MTRTGKIARLRQDVREELNQRLHDGEPGTRLLAWLNSHPETKRVLAAEFGGREINAPNLTAWRAGGFKDWLAQRELRERARKMATEPKEPGAVMDDRMTDHLSSVLALQYADVLMNWNREVTPEFRRRLRALTSLCKDTVALRRIDDRTELAALERDRQSGQTKLR